MIRILEKHHRIAWILSISTMVFIFYMSSLTSITVLSNLPYRAELYHFGIYCVLTLFMMIALSEGGVKKHLFIWAITISFIYALSDELHQLFVPGRFASITDVVLDAMGITKAGTFYIFRHRNNNNKSF